MFSLETLEALTIQEVPADFFRQLVSRQPAVYAEANDLALNNPSWRRPEGEMVVPHIRRAVFEHEVRLAAGNANLQHFDLRHAGDNCGYGMVRAGKLAISTHHIAGPNQFVRRCKSRQQHAAVNKFLDQLALDEILVEPIPKLEEAGIVYAHLLHGRVIERHGDKEFTQDFLRLAFPDADLQKYSKNYSVLELLQKYAAYSGADTAAGGHSEDKVVPILNPKKKTEVIN